METGVFHTEVFFGTGLNLMGTNKMGGGKIVQIVSGLPLANHTVRLGRSIIGGKPFVSVDGTLIELNEDTLDFLSRDIAGTEVVSPTGFERRVFANKEVKGPIKRPTKEQMMPIYVNFMSDLEKV